jgi:hypothetical protein
MKKSIKKLLVALKLFCVLVLLISCVSVPTKYSENCYSIDCFNYLLGGTFKDEGFKQAIQTSKSLNCRYFSYSWDSSVLSFCPVKTYDELISWKDEPFTSKYYDIEKSTTGTVPKYKRISNESKHFFDREVLLYDRMRPEVDLTKLYRQESIIEKDFVHAIMPYSFGFTTSDAKGTWYYPLKGLQTYVCNESGVRQLTKFNYDKNKMFANDYTNSDCLVENEFYSWTISRGYLKDTGVLSLDHEIYMSLFGAKVLDNYNLPTDFVVVKLNYGSFSGYKIYYLPTGYDGKCYITEVFHVSNNLL